MSRFAEAAFVAFAWAQGVALLCLVPALLAGVIADEYQRKTLHYLLASRMSSASIVLGKFAARLLHVGVILLIGVPVVCLVALFGGLDPKEVFYVYAGTFSLVAFRLGRLAAGVGRGRLRASPLGAILTAYVLVAAWLFLPLGREVDRQLPRRAARLGPADQRVRARDQPVEYLENCVRIIKVITIITVIVIRSYKPGWSTSAWLRRR